jgi:hypothetical protein
MTRKDSDLFKTRDRLSTLERDCMQLKEHNREIASSLEDARADLKEEQRMRAADSKEHSRLKLLGMEKIQELESEVRDIKERGKAMIVERDQRIQEMELVIQSMTQEG